MKAQKTNQIPERKARLSGGVKWLSIVIVTCDGTKTNGHASRAFRTSLDASLLCQD